MKVNQSEFLKIIGVGAFLFLSIQELSSLFEYVLRDLHSLIVSESKTFLWLPEGIGLILFIVLILWTFKAIPIFFKKDSNKLFIFLITIFFLILFLQLLYARIGTDFLLHNYFEEFDAYFDARKNYLTQITIGIIHSLKYVGFVALLIIKRKTDANNTYN